MNNQIKQFSPFFAMSKNLKFLCLSSFLFSLGDGLFLFSLPVYITQLNASPSQVGMLYAVHYLTWGITVMVGGFLADHFDQKKIMILGNLLWLPLPLTLATATDWNQLWLPMILYGTFFGSSSYSLYVLRSAPQKKTMQTFGLSSASLALGYVISPIPGGFIAATIGKQPLFFLVAVFFVASIFPLIFLSRFNNANPQKRQMHNLFPKFPFPKKLILICAFVCLIMFAIFLVQPLIPQFMNSVYNQNLFNLGIFGAATSMGWFLFSLVLGKICTDRSKLIAVIMSTIIFIFSILLIMMINNLCFLFLACFLMGVSSCIIEFAPAIVGPIAPERYVGQWISISETSIYIATCVAPIIGGILYEFSPYLAFFSTIFLLIGLTVIALSKNIDK